MELPNGSDDANGSLVNPPNGSGLFGCLAGDLTGDFGGAGLGGGAFFCFGGNAGRGDSLVFEEDDGAKGSLPNKSPPNFCKKKIYEKVQHSAKTGSALPNDVNLFFNKSIVSGTVYKFVLKRVVNMANCKIFKP